MAKLKRIITSTTKKMMVFAGLIVFVSVVIQVLNTIFRKWFGFAILWCDEVTQYAVIEALFLATPFLLLHGKQLSVGIMDAVIKNKTVLKIIRLVFIVLEIIIFFLLSRYCFDAAAGLVSSGVSLNTVPVKKYVIYYIAEATFIVDFIGLISAPIINKGGLYSD